MFSQGIFRTKCDACGDQVTWYDDSGDCRGAEPRSGCYCVHCGQSYDRAEMEARDRDYDKKRNAEEAAAQKAKFEQWREGASIVDKLRRMMAGPAPNDTANLAADLIVDLYYKLQAKEQSAAHIARVADKAVTNAELANNRLDTLTHAVADGDWICPEINDQGQRCVHIKNHDVNHHFPSPPEAAEPKRVTQNCRFCNDARCTGCGPNGEGVDDTELEEPVMTLREWIAEASEAWAERFAQEMEAWLARTGGGDALRTLHEASPVVPSPLAREEAERLLRDLASMEGEITIGSSSWAREETVEALESFKRGALSELEDSAGLSSGGKPVMRSGAILELRGAIETLVQRELTLMRLAGADLIDEAGKIGCNSNTAEPTSEDKAPLTEGIAGPLPADQYPGESPAGEDAQELPQRGGKKSCSNPATLPEGTPRGDAS